jgi:glucosamine--fructose-6-phosphate aminotransferase (isomerizing)
VRHAFESLTGLPLEAAEALDYAAYGVVTANARTLVIGLSSGGSTPAVMAALRRARERGATTVGVSNTPGSAVLTRFDAGLLVHATRKGWPTQASTAALALLVRLAASLAEAKGTDASGLADELAALPGLMDHVLAGLDRPVAALAERLAPAALWLFTGLGPNFAAASFGAAKIRELSPVHALAIPLEEMHHYRLPKRGDPLVIVATDAASRERALDTALVGEAVGARMVAVLSAPDPEIGRRVDETLLVPACAPALAPLLSSLPLHLLAYHFAMARFARGLGYPGGMPEGSGG